MFNSLKTLLKRSIVLLLSAFVISGCSISPNIAMPSIANENVSPLLNNADGDDLENNEENDTKSQEINIETGDYLEETDSDTKYQEEAKEQFGTTILQAEEEECNEQLDNETSDDTDTTSHPLPESPEKQRWRFELDKALLNIKLYCRSSDDYEMYCFFTDPHMFDGGGYGANATIMGDWIDFLEEAYYLSGSNFIMCGGDLLNNSDSKAEACYKLSTFDSMMHSRFDNYHFVVGNHDTNYQGDTYMNSSDIEGCVLSQQTINDLLFDGQTSYYSFSTSKTSYYCFDSGTDWEDGVYTSYKKEQINWFANQLLNDSKPHKVIILHIPLDYRLRFTELTSRIDVIVKAFNERRTVVVDGNSYNFSSSCGKVELVQAGHFHNDLNGFHCGGVPMIITRSFSSSEIATMPTFDFVFLDYSHSIARCIRVGDGGDRTFFFRK